MNKIGSHWTCAALVLSGCVAAAHPQQKPAE